MERLVTFVERAAGCFIGVLALIACGEAVLRYVFNAHIPDGFIIGQTLQGIAICWGISTATYADRQITVDILYDFSPGSIRRAFDVAAFTINLLFLALFGSYGRNDVVDVQHQRDGKTTVATGLKWNEPQ